MKIISYWTRSPVFNGDIPSVLTSTRTSSPSSEVATTRQTDGAAHKLKPRSFHKSAHLRVHPADFHPGVNRTWHWVKNLSTSTLTFNIVQFFPSLNYYLLILIMKKVDFDNCIVSFFAHYLMDRKTNYFWNNFMFPIFNINVGVGQSSALLPILSALYLLLFIYILEKCLKNLKNLVSIISFVDNGLFISQSNSFDISNSRLFCSYNVLTNLLKKFGLVVEHSKTENFHFNRSQGIFNPPSLDLSLLGGSILQPNNLWKYLGFIFDRKLTFHQHVDFYANKSISTVKCMKILSNSNYRINSL